MKIAVPDEKNLVHEMKIPMRWGDMDALGHVNNTVHFRYLEIIRIDWLRGLGGLPDPAGEGPVVANTFCNFFHQLEYPGDVLVRMFTGEVGRSSLDTWVTMERADQPGRISANGGATVVWVDYARRQPTPLPDWLRAHIPGAS